MSDIRVKTAQVMAERMMEGGGSELGLRREADTKTGLVGVALINFEEIVDRLAKLLSHGVVYESSGESQIG